MSNEPAPAYRWNQFDNARGYDAAAEHLHPHYRAIQDVILKLLPIAQDDAACVIDLGGGSGRLAERILDRWPRACVVVLDQSEAFLSLARQRLQPFGERADFLQARLQSEWSGQLPDRARAIVSMSAIHHLDAVEKQRLYQQCFDSLEPGGALLNGDEVRPERDDDYLAECRRWAEHMQRVMSDGLVPESMQSALQGWIARNVGRFGEPRVSGDDCHETAATQLRYFANCGFANTQTVWQQELWAVLKCERSRHALSRQSKRRLRG